MARRSGQWDLGGISRYRVNVCSHLGVVFSATLSIKLFIIVGPVDYSHIREQEHFLCDLVWW